MARDRLRVLVLTGGTSSEREICLRSGAKVVAALDPARYEVTQMDLADLAGPQAGRLARALFAPGACEPEADGRPDVVFIALHGGAGEDGTVQGMLELLGIPYTGSGVLASALAMNKIVSKKVFEREGIPTPRWWPLRAAERADAGRAVLEALRLPCVVKPACEGSTIGVTVVRDPTEMEPALEEAFRYGPEALAEEYIAGVEISGPVLGEEALPLVEIVPRSGFYDYEAKYTPGATEEIVPARIPAWQAARARELTLAAHRVLGCRGMSRVDMMASEDEVYVLEVNTIPGMTETSILPRAAEAVGMTFSQVVDRLIELALEERGRHGARRGL